MKKAKAPPASEPKQERRVILTNRRARHEYSILETFEAGIALVGTEVKSLRAGNASLQEAYARFTDGELWLHNMHIHPYEQGSRYNVDPVRPRKLLLHRRELDSIRSKVEQKGMTIVPLSLYLRNGYAKLEIGLGRGKKLWDRRQDIASREAQRDAQRHLADRGE
jgi:SsrA-binding protein